MVEKPAKANHAADVWRTHLESCEESHRIIEYVNEVGYRDTQQIKIELLKFLLVKKTLIRYCLIPFDILEVTWMFEGADVFDAVHLFTHLSPHFVRPSLIHTLKVISVTHLKVILIVMCFVQKLLYMKCFI